MKTVLKERSSPAQPISQAGAPYSQELDAESRARSRIRKIWQPGDLFHNFTRFPQKPDAPCVDRLAQILAKGLIAPASCDDESVCSDLDIVFFGAPVPYNSLVFLHRFGQESSLYLSSCPDRFTVFHNYSRILDKWCCRMAPSVKGGTIS